MNENKIIALISEDISFLKSKLESDRERFIECIFSSSDFVNSNLAQFHENIDRQLILKLIDKIIVHEKDKETKLQDISIHYKYIGILDRNIFS